MTPTNPTGSNTPQSPLWQRIVFGLIGLIMAYYLIFHVALPGFHERQAELNGPSSQSSAPH